MGGDRGSGKTEIVTRVISDLPKESLKLIWYQRLRTWTFAQTISINIPLRVLSTKAGDEHDLRDAYRSRLLRSMLAGLVIDLKSRYEVKYSWLDLPLRWFRPIGYVQRVYSIRHYSAYVSLATSKSRSLSFGFKGTNSALQAALEAEMDISDSKLEMELSSILRQYSKAQKIIFVFDELDKLPELVSLDEIVVYLKNLFSGTGAYGIFITDSVSYKNIIKNASKIPPSQHATLFSDHLLVNNMNIEDFELLSSSIINFDNGVNKSELMAALSHYTNRSPHVLQKYILKNGLQASTLLPALKNDIGSYKFSRISALTKVTDSVYEMYSNLSRDDSYRRLLNDSLKKSSEILSDNKTAYIDQTEPDTVLFITDIFTADELSKSDAGARDLQFKIDRKFSNEISYPESYEVLKDLNDDERNNIRTAIGTLITYLERNNFINLSNTRHKDVYKIGQISADLTLTKYDEINWDESFQLSEIEKKTYESLKRYNAAVLKLTKKSLVDNRYVITNLQKANRRYGKYGLRNTRVNWDGFKTITDNAESNILKGIFDAVNSLSSPELTSSPYAKNILNIIEGKKLICRIVILYGRQPQPSPDQNVKTFIFRDESSGANKNKRDSMTKNFRINKNWSNVSSAVKEVARYINSIDI